MREVLTMKTKAIDHIIKTIERKADEIGYDIDNNPDYILMCRIVTDFDYDGIVPTYEEKAFCADTLERLCGGLGLQYHALLDEALKNYA